MSFYQIKRGCRPDTFSRLKCNQTVLRKRAAIGSENRRCRKRERKFIPHASCVDKSDRGNPSCFSHVGGR